MVSIDDSIRCNDARLDQIYPYFVVELRTNTPSVFFSSLSIRVLDLDYVCCAIVLLFICECIYTSTNYTVIFIYCSAISKTPFFLLNLDIETEQKGAFLILMYKCFQPNSIRDSMAL